MGKTGGKNGLGSGEEEWELAGLDMAQA